MRLESKRWAPSRWSERRLRKVLRHAYARAHADLCYMLGPHEGNIVTGLAIASLASAQSRAMLEALGIKMLGNGGE